MARKPESIKIKRTKDYNSFEVKMHVTEGKILAILHALEIYKEQSPVAYDVQCMLEKALDVAKETANV